MPATDPQIFPAEVKEVIYKDNKGFDIYKIRYRSLKRSIISSGKGGLETARPLDANIKRIPIIGEVVLILSAPDRSSSKLNQGSEDYYINTVNIQNSVHHNALLNTSDVEQQGTTTNTNNSDIRDISAGNANRNIPTTKSKLGETFNERRDIGPLQPYEGDLLIEGRWGQSIRFGSTILGGDYSEKSPWKKGESALGDPIIVISNGYTGKDKKFQVENINEDAASIYLTRGQSVTFKRESTLDSAIEGQGIHKQSTDNEGNQIILASDRLLFNSRKRETVFFSGGGFGVSSKKSIAFDTNKELEINAREKIKLGIDAEEPLILGNEDKEFRIEMLDILSELAQNLSVAQTPGYGSPLHNNLTYSDTKLKLEKLKQKFISSDRIYSALAFTKKRP